MFNKQIDILLVLIPVGENATNAIIPFYWLDFVLVNELCFNLEESLGDTHFWGALQNGGQCTSTQLTASSVIVAFWLTFTIILYLMMLEQRQQTLPHRWQMVRSLIPQILLHWNGHFEVNEPSLSWIIGILHKFNAFCLNNSFLLWPWDNCLFFQPCVLGNIEYHKVSQTGLILCGFIWSLFCRHIIISLFGWNVF